MALIGIQFSCLQKFLAVEAEHGKMRSKPPAAAGLSRCAERVAHALLPVVRIDVTLFGDQCYYSASVSAHMELVTVYFDVQACYFYSSMHIQELL